MPPESVPAQWLRYAKKDLELASIEMPPEGVLELLCFHAQQAVEKALKAVLVSRGEAPPRTHDIAILLEQIEAFTSVPSNLLSASRLNEYAVWTRYPGDAESVYEEDYQEAVRIARLVLGWVEDQLYAG